MTTDTKNIIIDIHGPRDSGKSTVAAIILPALRQAGISASVFTGTNGADSEFIEDLSDKPDMVENYVYEIQAKGTKVVIQERTDYGSLALAAAHCSEPHNKRHPHDLGVDLPKRTVVFCVPSSVSVEDMETLFLRLYNEMSDLVKKADPEVN